MEDKKKIVFYAGFPPPILLYKIARLFKKNNYETILFTMCEKDRFDEDFNKQAFDKIICSNFQFSKPSLKTAGYLIKRVFSLMKFLTLMKLIKPYAVIGLSGNNWQLKLVHKYLFKKYPFIYFPYDILSQYFNSKEEALKKGIKPFELDAEKYCLENSDGIIHKGDPNELNLFNGETFYNADVQKLQLSFLPYCSKEFIVPLNREKISRKDKEIHLAYPGFLLNKSEHIKEISNSLNEILNQKIHIHIYGMVSHISKKESDKYFDDMFHKFMKNKYFHLHKPLGPKEIVKEISKYDYGFYLTYIFNTPEIKLHTTHKLSTFLEAGLPIIYFKGCSFIDKLMGSYNIGASYNRQNLKNLGKNLKKLNYQKLVETVEKAREDFDMDKNFPRLEKFIERVVMSRKNIENNNIKG